MKFIEKVMEKIWEPYNNDLKEKEEMYLQMDPKILSAKFSEVIAPYYLGEDDHLTGLLSSGCPHWYNEGKLGGCTFCDFYTKNFEGFIILNALRKKDITEYSKIISLLFKKKRQSEPEARVVESITAFDSLNPEEVTPEIVDEILAGNNGLFEKGFHILNCETRATSILVENIRRWKKNVNGRMIIEFGVEVSNEWLRNHWINKNITDTDISKAIEVIKKERCMFTNDLLLGIPGLTESQSIDLFIDAIDFCISRGARHVVVSPLLRKGNNLQWFIERNFADDPELNAAGVTGNGPDAIHVVSVFTAVYEAVKRYPQYASKIYFAPGHLQSYCESVKASYRDFVNLKDVEIILNGLQEYSISHKIEPLEETYQSIKNNSFHIKQKDKVAQQHGIHEVDKTILLTSKKITQKLWGEQWQKYYAEISEETKNWEMKPLVSETRLH